MRTPPRSDNPLSMKGRDLPQTAAMQLTALLGWGEFHYGAFSTHALAALHIHEFMIS